MAVRSGPWKVHYQEHGSYGTEPKKLTKLDAPKLYHLERDPSERYNIAKQNPKILSEIQALVDQHLATLEPATSQLEDQPLNSN
jgi:hypothetical protein